MYIVEIFVLLNRITNCRQRGYITHCNIYLPQEGCDKRMYNGFDKAAEVLKINGDTNLHRIVKYQTNYF